VFGVSSGGYAGYVDGNVHVTGRVSTAGGDCAEDFDIVSGELIEPGMVLVAQESGARSAGVEGEPIAGIPGPLDRVTRNRPQTIWGIASCGDDDTVGWRSGPRGFRGGVLVDRPGAGRRARRGDQQRGVVVSIPG
jgi:hypothetical protein